MLAWALACSSNGAGTLDSGSRDVNNRTDTASGDVGSLDGGSLDGGSRDGGPVVKNPDGTYAKKITLPDCGTKEAPPVGVLHITAAADFDELDDAQFDTFCVHSGDYSSAGELKISSAGTASEKRTLRYFDAAQAAAVPHPVGLAQGARAVLQGLSFESGAAHWQVVGLSLTHSDGNLITFEDGAHNNLVDRMLLEGAGGGSGQVQVIGDDNTVQNSVLRKTAVVSGSDVHCIKIRHGAKGTRVVDSEIYDCAGDGIQVGGDDPSDVFSGTVIAGNDIYCEAYCGMGENGIDLKGAGASGEGNWLQIDDNRMWGKWAGGGTSSTSLTQALVDVSAEDANKSYVSVRANVLFDAYVGIKPSKGSPSDPGRSDHWSIVGNVIYDIVNGAIDIGENSPFAEVHHNTIIKSDAWFNDDGDSSEGADIRCNLVIDAVEAVSSASGTTFAYNAFYGTSVATGSNALAGTLAESQTTDLCVEIKRLTGPQTRCIPNARPQAGSPVIGACDPSIGSAANAGLTDIAPPGWRDLAGDVLEAQIGAVSKP